MAEGTLYEGALIADRYELVSSLGGGGFGEVWRAKDRRFGREMAVKFMRVEMARDAALRRRFAKEARALAAINHPNVVQVFDDGEWQGRPFVVLQLVEGSTLREWMEGYQKIRKLPPAEEVRSLFAQVCVGVGAAHAKGIVHRDLKPENVLIEFDDDGRATAKVLDFGLARGGTLQMSTGLAGGTPAYMSPEQATEGVEAAGPTSDVFSLGVMLVELLTRRLLPESPKQTTWWNAAQLGRAGAAVGEASRVRGDVPSAVWSVVLGALSTEPESRPTTASALRRAVESAWGGAAASVSSEAVGGSAGAAATGAAVDPVASVAPFTSMVMDTVPAPSPMAPWGPPTGLNLPMGGPSPPAFLPVVESQGVSTESDVQSWARFAPPELPTVVVPSAPRKQSWTGVARGVLVGLATLPMATCVAALYFHEPEPPPEQTSVSVLPLPLGPTLPIAALAPAAAGVTAPRAPVVVPVPRALTCPQGSVLIPAGEFWMGSPEGEGQAEERPRHRVRSGAFCLDRTEVTVAAYRTCTAAHQCSEPSPYRQARGDSNSACNWGRSGTDTHPVNSVDWEQARGFCRWSGGRLPTETEWEYAARGTEGRSYPWGNTSPDATRANLCGSECIAALTELRLNEGSTAISGWTDAWGLTAPVGSFPAGNTPEGLQDMSGNVAEWTEDGSDATAYAHRPADFTAQRTGSQSTESRVSRGGGWFTRDAHWVRAASRSGTAPALRYSHRGFRCARGAR